MMPVLVSVLSLSVLPPEPSSLGKARSFSDKLAPVIPHRNSRLRATTSPLNRKATRVLGRAGRADRGQDWGFPDAGERLMGISWQFSAPKLARGCPSGDHL